MSLVLIGRSPASAQARSDSLPDVAGLEARLVEQEFRFRQTADSLSRRLAQLDASLARDQSTGARVEALVARIDVLEDANRTAFLREIARDSLRYETGREILFTVLNNADKLDVTVKITSNLTRFQGLANPGNHPAYTAALNRVRETPASNGILELLPTQLQNPLFSSIFSLASVIGSRLNAGERLRRFGEITCVVDFTTRTTADLRVVENDLARLNLQVTEFKTEGQRLFRTFGQVVGYSQAWPQYKTDRATLPSDPLSQAIGQHFTAIRTASQTTAGQGLAARSAGWVNARHQLREIEGLLEDYERLLDSTEQFLQRYSAVLGEHRIATCSSIPNLGQQLTTLHSEAVGLLSSFPSRLPTGHRCAATQYSAGDELIGA